jgi:transposase
MEIRKNKYSLEFKLKALDLVKERGNLLSVAQELNISHETLKNWKKGRYLGSDINSSSIKVKSKEEEELIRLRKELYETKLERDILKKAVGIFSKNDR